MAESTRPDTIRWYESLLIAGALVLVFALGLPHLDGPSLWHDELVHVHVAKSLAGGHGLALPSGAIYPSAAAYHAYLAPFIASFGDSARAVRTPSVLAHAVAVLVAYFVARRFLGRATALVTAFMLALCPWTVSWSREARFYALQSAVYPATLALAWTALNDTRPRIALAAACAACLLYVAGFFTAFHLILAIGPVGAYAGLRWFAERRVASRWTAALVLCTLLGVLSILFLVYNPNPVDRSAVFGTGLGGRLMDPQRVVRDYYFRWLLENLSLGYFLVALFGFASFFGKGWRGAYLVFAFWVPVLLLTFFMGYRRDRFMYFAFPFYGMAAAYGLTQLARVGRYAAVGLRQRRWIRALPLLILLPFGARLGLSTAYLVRDSIEIASGSPENLASSHPDWRKAADYVRTRRNGDAILASTFLPAYYYIGHVDNWFPNRYTDWEYQESGLRGLGSLRELKEFLRTHPKGFYLAEYVRFGMHRGHSQLTDLNAEIDWVHKHMQKIEAVSTGGVLLFQWDFTGRDPAELK